MSAYLCMVGKLACVAVNIPTEEVLSEQEPVKKPAYTLHTTWGKRLTPEQVAKVEKALACNEVALVGEADDGSGWKQYVCNEDGFQFELRPSKEA
ncbi:hypothetical protein [Clostridium sp.]|uniref:hypothetical protein n=1 Tax=Clostridium sp. TaxID=1506 RepID=UPI0028494645|nr:hypothetical protein [Clostridium sp.]MDR3597072.1 hypothetical protein [Clostridium sp.]